MAEHPCANGLTAACIKAYPVWARKAIAYRILHYILPKQLSKNLPRLSGLPNYPWNADWDAWISFILSEWGFPWEYFPKDWKPGDPLPPGVILPPGLKLSDDGTITDDAGVIKITINVTDKSLDVTVTDRALDIYIPDHIWVNGKSETGVDGPVFVKVWEGGPDTVTGKRIIHGETWPPMLPLSAYVLSQNGTGTISYSSGKITMSTNSAAFSGYSLRRVINPPPMTYVWTKDRSWGAKFSLGFGNETGQHLFAGMGYHPDTGHGIGFIFTDTAIIGRTGNGTSSTSVNLVTGLVKPYTSTHAFEIDYTANTKAEFYIDDSKKGEITTTLPTQSAAAKIILNYYLLSTGAVLHTLISSSFKTTQVS